MKLHVCNGCGKEKMLDERVRHWHDCHPAHFSFIVKSDKELIAQIVGATQHGVQRTLRGKGSGKSAKLSRSRR